jgi:hypothetical protein
MDLGPGLKLGPFSAGVTELDLRCWAGESSLGSQPGRCRPLRREDATPAPRGKATRQSRRSRRLAALLFDCRTHAGRRAKACGAGPAAVWPIWRIIVATTFGPWLKSWGGFSLPRRNIKFFPAGQEPNPSVRLDGSDGRSTPPSPSPQSERSSRAPLPWWGFYFFGSDVFKKEGARKRDRTKFSRSGGILPRRGEPL